MILTGVIASEDLINKLHEEYCNSLIVNTAIKHLKEGVFNTKEDALVVMVQQLYKTNKGLMEELINYKQKYG
jgi:hypothetical protein